MTVVLAFLNEATLASPFSLGLQTLDKMIDETIIQAQAAAMRAAAERTGKQLMIAQCIRFWPEYRYLQRCVQEETFGKLISLNM